MRNKLALYLLSSLIATPSVFAQFEGVMEMKLAVTAKEGGPQGEGTLKVAISKAGARSEMKMQMQQMAVDTVTLVKSGQPDTMYRISDAAKRYTVIDLAKLRQMAPPARAEEKFTVKKLGEAKILGYNTQHVLVTGKDTSTELWTAKDLMDYDTFNKLQAHGARVASADAMNKALKDAGADGVPLKSISTTPDGARMTMEVIKAEKQALPASTFEIPAGYTKSEGGMMGGMGMSGMSSPRMDEAKKKMDEALKNMSPEQREMMEKMMKQRQGANQ